MEYCALNSRIPEHLITKVEKLCLLTFLSDRVFPSFFFVHLVKWPLITKNIRPCLD